MDVGSAIRVEEDEIGGARLSSVERVNLCYRES